MEHTDNPSRDLAALQPMEYGALMIRVGVGLLYLSHSVLMWAIFGLQHAGHYFVSVGMPLATAYVIFAAELVGAVMLILGLYPRATAIGLLPIAIGTALVHLGTGLGASLGYSAYLAGCLLGQGLLASGVLTRVQRAAGDDEFAFLTRQS